MTEERIFQLKKKHYALTDSEDRMIVKILEIDFSGESPLIDKIAKPELTRKIMLSLSSWRGPSLVSLTIENGAIDSFLVTAIFDTEDGPEECEFKLEAVEII
jgi:hypothetical protein